MENEQVQHFEQQGVELITKARELKIIDQMTRETAVVFRADVNQAVKNIVGFFKPMKEKAHAAWKTICNQETALTGKFEEAKKIVDVEINRDYQEQKRIQEEADRKAREEAAEKERKERERLDALALKQMEKGKFRKAEETMQKADQVFVPVVSSAPEAQKTVKINGATASMIEDIEVSVTDAKVFCGAVATGRFPIHLIEIKLGEVKRYVKAMGIAEMAGIQITKTSRVSSRKG